jgi:hypothetical protein
LKPVADIAQSRVRNASESRIAVLDFQKYSFSFSPSASNVTGCVLDFNLEEIEMTILAVLGFVSQLSQPIAKSRARFCSPDVIRRE